MGVTLNSKVKETFEKFLKSITSPLFIHRVLWLDDKFELTEIEGLVKTRSGKLSDFAYLFDKQRLKKYLRSRCFSPNYNPEEFYHKWGQAKDSQQIHKQTQEKVIHAVFNADQFYKQTKLLTDSNDIKEITVSNFTQFVKDRPSSIILRWVEEFKNLKKINVGFKTMNEVEVEMMLELLDLNLRSLWVWLGNENQFKSTLFESDYAHIYFHGYNGKFKKLTCNLNI